MGGVGVLGGVVELVVEFKGLVEFVVELTGLVLYVVELTGLVVFEVLLVEFETIGFGGEGGMGGGGLTQVLP